VLPPVARLVMFAFAAELLSRKTVVPPNWFEMVVSAAVVALRNRISPPSLVIEVTPDMLALKTLSKPSLMTAPTIDAV
jgi:hypothetical protein